MGMYVYVCICMYIFYLHSIEDPSEVGGLVS